MTPFSPEKIVHLKASTKLVLDGLSQCQYKLDLRHNSAASRSAATACAGRLLGLLPDPDTVLLRLRDLYFAALHAIVDCSCESDECLDDIAGVQGRCFEVIESVAERERLSIDCGDDAIVREIGFVADEQNHRIRSAERLEVRQPDAEVVERLLVILPENKDAADRIAKIRFRDRFEFLLTGGIPNIQFHNLIVADSPIALELNANRRAKGGRKTVINEALDKGGFADTRGADNNDFVASIGIAARESHGGIDSGF
jgi:hypothetical protein